MKKAVAIGAVGICSLVIGVTMIAQASPMSKKEVTISEKEEVKMNERAAINVSSLDNLILPEILEAKRVELAETAERVETEAPAGPQETVSPDAGASNAEIMVSQAITQENSSFDDNISDAEVVSPAAPQEEAPVIQSQETDIENVAQSECYTPQAECNPQQTECNPGDCTFTDANHDGYCDYGDVHYHDGSHMDANHDGYCDYGDHYCMNDSDGDGVCDNYQNTQGNGHHNNQNCVGNAYGNSGSGAHHSERHNRGHHH